MEPVVDQAAAVAPPPLEVEGSAEMDALMERAQSLMARITSSQHNPNPRVLHALASLLETEESRYVQEFGHSSFNNTRASHNIGRLGSLIRENEEFLDLVSSKFLSDSRFNTSIRAAASRLLLACSAAWMYPHVLEDDVLENIKHWVMDDTIPTTSGEYNSKAETDTSKPSDIEMLRTYATGLLTVSLSGGGQLVEDVLMSGLSSKLMRFLRIRVLGETSTSQKEAGFPTEGKHASGGARGREEGRSRFRQVTDATRLDAAKASDEGLLDDQIIEKDHDRAGMPKQMHGKECREDGLTISARDMPIDGMSDDDEQVGACTKDFYEEKTKLSERISLGRSMRDEDMDENIRDESSRYKAGRAGTHNRGKERASEIILETERSLTSPGAGMRIGSQARSARDRNQTKTIDPKRAVDTKKDPSKASADVLAPEKEDNDDSSFEVKVGTVDVSELVKKAKRAAEAEARAANAPPDAVKAAGDAAMELVKTAALEAFNSTNNEEAVVEAAAKAASTVVEAAIATEVSRSQMNFDQEAPQSSSLEPEKEEELEGFFIPDRELLAQLRERYCIQCLQLLGEYVEVLGPVLHEKGVDVCLTLLQRNNNATEPSKNLMVLSDVLKLVCALAAHRKFAALFVDRGGMQRILAVRRVSQTFVGLSSCLFAIGSLQGIMERFCALPSDVVHQVVELALQLLECSQDQARKNAALFFGAAFVFRAVLDSFDTQDGLAKLLNLLRGAASVRSGVNSGSLGLSNLRNDRAPTEVLSASEKQIAYHTCVALRQYFRSHLLLVDSLRPNKNHRSGARNISSARAAYKPLDISNEAMDAIFLLLQRDRKIGPAFVRVRWPPVDKFLSLNGHTTLLELCQAPPVDRYLHDLAQYALGVLHIVTLVPYSRRAIISSTLSNERVGMAVILDAANGAGYGDPEVIQPALNLLVNLCCPPPSLCNKLSLPQGQHASVQNPSGLSGTDHKERHTERSLSDRAISFAHTEARERAGELGNNERGGPLHSTTPAASGSQPSAPLASGVVGDRRISLGSGTGSAGLAAFMEQGYRQAWEAVRANNGIKVLLHLLHPRILIPPASLDCIRALACRVLLGLARDDSIAHILTKLQVGKLLSELIRDSGSQSSGTEQGRWQAELGQVAMELIAIVTNSGRASTLAATDAAAPTLRRIERAAIAAATPITYHARELLLLIHEHLVASGMNTTADSLLKEAQLAPLPSLSSSFPLLHQTSIQDNPKVELQWPSRVSGRFLSDTLKVPSRIEDPGHKRDSSATASRRKPVFSSNLTCPIKGQLLSQPLGNKVSSASKNPCISTRVAEVIPTSSPRPASDMETPSRTPLGLPMKRKLMDRDLGLAPLTKRLATNDLVFLSPTACKTPISAADNLDDIQGQATPTLLPLTSNGQQSQHGFIPDTPSHPERVTLDSLVVQYLKHQHRQCPAPITTLPPLSLLHPHVCPEPSRRLDMPVNLVARLSTRESRTRYGGIHGHRRDRQFVFSRFRPWRTCRDEAALLTCISFLGDASRIVTGSHAGELKIFDVNSSNVLESHLCHQTPVMLVQSSSPICRTWSDSSASARELLLSSSAFDVRLWDSSSLSAGPLHIFDGRKAARFNHAGNVFATVASELSRREVLLYDVETCHLDQKLSDTPASAGPIRSHVQSIIHFSPSDEMVLWNGILWDRRVSRPIHRFDQFTDYGGGGFHPAGNEVIINSEVWDLKKFKLLRSVPSLDQTIINFNAGGDIIYAMLRRNLEDITSAVHTRRVRHPLFAAFRTVDAVNYSDIATIPVDRCVLDFATEPTDSFVGVVAMDDHEEMFSSARLYEIGRRRSTDDDSDPDDGVETDEEDDDEDDSEADEDPLVAAGLDADVDSDGIDLSNDDDDDTGDELDDADFNSDDEGDFDNGAAILELVSEDDEGDDNQVVESLSSEDEGWVDFTSFI
ncbi:DDB1- and CUL4-associated factor homolog 1 [Nymphaea colorata]|nr:DDB1- and CUL4-associated factor homolog 1 [Nymphaea colorata]